METTIIFAATLTVFFLLEILLLVINTAYNKLASIKTTVLEKEIKDASIYEIALLKGNTQDIFKLALSNLLQNDIIQNNEITKVDSLTLEEEALIKFEKKTTNFSYQNLKYLLNLTHLNSIARNFYNHDIYKPVKIETLNKLNKLKLFNPIYKFWKIKLFIYLTPIIIAIIYYMSTKQDLSFFLGLVMLIIFMTIIFHLSLSNTNRLTKNGIKYCELFEIFKTAYPNVDKDLTELIKQYNIEYHYREIQ